MQRLIFYGIIILVVVLLFVLLNVALYWVLRIVLAKHTATVVSRIILFVMALIITVSCWWGNTRTRLSIQVNEVAFASPRLPEAFDGFRIAQLSDMHLSSFEPAEGRAFLSQLADTLATLKPDVIVFTGDIVTARAAEAIPFRDALSAIAHIQRNGGLSTIPVYSILGNHDYADYMHQFSPERRQQDRDSLVQIQTEAGWRVLKNESVHLSRLLDDTTSQHIILAGVENIGEPPFSVYGNLDAAFTSFGGITAADSTFSILLSHNPTHWRREVLPRTHIDLMLAGHTHASQCLVGSWSPSKWKYDEWMGLYSEGDQALYVNTGIGCVGPKVRIGVKPEVSVITLHKE